MVTIVGIFHPPPSNNLLESQPLIRADEMAKMYTLYKGKPVYIEHRTWENAVGEVEEIGYGPAGQVVGKIRLYSNTPEGQQAVADVKSGRLSSLSVGLRFKCDAERTNVHDVVPLEVSLCEEGRLADTYVVSCDDPNTQTLNISLTGLQAFTEGPSFDSLVKKAPYTLKPTASTAWFARLRNKEAKRYSADIPLFGFHNMTDQAAPELVIQNSETDWQKQLLELPNSDEHFMQVKNHYVALRHRAEETEARLRELEAGLDTQFKTESAKVMKALDETLGNEESGLTMHLKASASEINPQEVREVFEYLINNKIPEGLNPAQQKLYSTQKAGMLLKVLSASMKANVDKHKTLPSSVKGTGSTSEPKGMDFLEDMKSYHARNPVLHVQNSTISASAAPAAASAASAASAPSGRFDIGALKRHKPSGGSLEFLS